MGNIPYVSENGKYTLVSENGKYTLVSENEGTNTDKYRIKVLLKVETDINPSCTVILIGRGVILVIMFVRIFKSYFIVFIDNVIVCFTSR